MAQQARAMAAEPDRSPKAAGLIDGRYRFSSSPNCDGIVTPLVANWFNGLDVASPMPAHVPVFGTPAVDSGACNISATPKIPSGIVTVDLRGTGRPQGMACDVGAIEAIDAIFANGFD
jgi:hypothetical protein